MEYAAALFSENLDKWQWNLDIIVGMAATGANE